MSTPTPEAIRRRLASARKRKGASSTFDSSKVYPHGSPTGYAPTKGTSIPTRGTKPSRQVPNPNLTQYKPH